MIFVAKGRRGCQEAEGRQDVEAVPREGQEAEGLQGRREATAEALSNIPGDCRDLQSPLPAAGDPEQQEPPDGGVQD